MPEEPFSSTENYQKTNAFIVGLQLADTYEYSDDCFNSVVDAIDQRAYFANNRTLHNQEMEQGLEKNYYKPYLNITGTIAGPVAEALPSCYSFTYSLYEVEQARFQTFNSNIGDFFLAFLFNQMGNALSFQTKFARIEELREEQAYIAMWQEYGDLVYIIWTFQPLEEAALETAEATVDSKIEQWFLDHEWMADDESS